MAARGAEVTEGPVIGFNELRQACEISALREDVARLSDEIGGLCGHIEDGVEQVRDRVAGLCAEELADPDVMAPLLQFAVGTLIAIRDRAREIDARVGATDDAERPDWTAAAPPKAASPLAPASAAPPVMAPPANAAPVERPPPVVRRAAEAPPPPPPAPLSAGGSWLAPPPLVSPPAPPPTRSAPTSVAIPAPTSATRGNVGPTSARNAAAGVVDWLGPARK